MCQNHIMMTSRTNLLNLKAFRDVILLKICFVKSSLWQLDLYGLIDIQELTVTTLTIYSTTPSINLAIIRKRQSMISSSTNLNNSCLFEVHYLFWGFSVLKVAMSALSFVVGWSSTAPCKHTTCLIKSNWVEITTSDLNNTGLLIYKALYEHGFMTTLSFLMQTSSPCENGTILWEG